MNIFFVDSDPVTAAISLCDKHVVKMILESAQMLSTAQHVFETNLGFIYKKTHVNHPCNIWIRKSKENYAWLLKHAMALCLEYNLRYNKQHKSSDIINRCNNFPKNLPDIGLTKPALAMPDEYKTNDPVESYRNYYIKDKLKNIQCKWTIRTPPIWIKDFLNDNQSSNTDM